MLQNVSVFRYAMTLLPMAAGSAAEPLYWRLMDEPGVQSPSPNTHNTAEHSDVQIYAINFGIKHLLFDHYLHRDLVW